MDVINTVGRRKTSVARVYMSKGKGTIVVNDRELDNYFATAMLRAEVHKPFHLTETANQFDIKVNVRGGGITGQAEAIRLGIARALCKYDNDFRPMLKVEGLMTRDPRMVERKKPGQKKARKKFQFSKR